MSFALNMLLLLLSVSSYLYQIAHLGDDDEEPEFSSAMPLEEGDTFFFQPRPLKNLVLVDELDSLSPILCCQVCCCQQAPSHHMITVFLIYRGIDRRCVILYLDSGCEPAVLCCSAVDHQASSLLCRDSG